MSPDFTFCGPWHDGKFRAMFRFKDGQPWRYVRAWRGGGPEECWCGENAETYDSAESACLGAARALVALIRKGITK